MSIGSLARSRGRRRRFRRSHRSGYRAVTLGPGHEDWAVVDADGRVVYRGYMLDAARLANELSR
jgi:hypothetical protein